MTPHRLAGLLEAIARTRIGIIGDFCLDAYWELDSGQAELSLETGKTTAAVRRQRYSPGGAGNVAANLCDLGVRSVEAFGIMTEDMFGKELAAQLRSRGVEIRGMVLQEGNWDTPVYAKPFRNDEEQERIDFGRWNRISRHTERQLLDIVMDRAAQCDALIVNQQLRGGVYTDAVVEGVNSAALRHPTLVCVLDARNMSERFSGMIAKMNAAEAARVCGQHLPPGKTPDRTDLRAHASTIAQKNGKPVYITRSTEGILLYDGAAFHDLPALPVQGVTDPVGAGDTTVAALTAALAAGASPVEAGILGNLAAAVTVRKLRQTGTATPAEIIAVAAQAGGFSMEKP